MTPKSTPMSKTLTPDDISQIGLKTRKFRMGGLAGVCRGWYFGKNEKIC